MNYADPSGHGLISTMVNTAKNVVNTVVNTVKSVVNTVVNTVASTVKAVTNTVVNTATKVVNAATNTATKAVNAAAKTIVPVVSAVAGTAGRIVGGALDMATGAAVAVSDFVSGVIYAGVSAGTNVLGTVLDMQVKTLTTLNREFCSAGAAKASAAATAKGLTAEEEQAVQALANRIYNAAVATGAVDTWRSIQDVKAFAFAIPLWWLIVEGIAYLLLAIAYVWALVTTGKTLGEAVSSGWGETGKNTGTRTDPYYDTFTNTSKNITVEEAEAAAAKAAAAEAAKKQEQEQEYVILYHYGYQSNAASYFMGLWAGSYYTDTDSYTGTQATNLLSLPLADKGYLNPDGVLTVQIPKEYYNTLMAAGQIIGPRPAEPRHWPGQAPTDGGGTEIRIMAPLTNGVNNVVISPIRSILP